MRLTTMDFPYTCHYILLMYITSKTKQYHFICLSCRYKMYLKYLDSHQEWKPPSVGLLRSEEWLFLIDVSGQPIGFIFKGQKSFPFRFLNLYGGRTKLGVSSPTPKQGKNFMSGNTYISRWRLTAC
jgi:hypothetical protein